MPLVAAQDYKRIGDGDVGPNTGGMGSYSPVPGVDDALGEELARTVHQPVLDELRHRGIAFHGCLYAGLMLTAAGPRTLEFNVRFGDPETQAVLPRLRSDLLELPPIVTVLRARGRGEVTVRLEVHITALGALEIFCVDTEAPNETWKLAFDMRSGGAAPAPEAAAAVTPVTDEEDPELAAYNRYLARLNETAE